MAKYDNFKKKAKSALGTIADVSVDAYKAAEEKTRVLARKTKLRAGIVNDKATIRRVSVEIGAKYYKKYKDDEGAEFSQLCEEIKCAYERIAAKEAEIAELKANASIRAEKVSKSEPKPEVEDKVEDEKEDEKENENPDE